MFHRTVLSSVLFRGRGRVAAAFLRLVAPLATWIGDGKVSRIYFRDIGFTNQILIYVDEVEVVDTLDCQSRDSGFKPRRQRQ